MYVCGGVAETRKSRASANSDIETGIAREYLPPPSDWVWNCPQGEATITVAPATAVPFAVREPETVVAKPASESFGTSSVTFNGRRVTSIEVALVDGPNMPWGENARKTCATPSGALAGTVRFAPKAPVGPV